ncbi:MAG: response regulator transcription factor [Bacteroidota bacterium]
MEKIRILIVEDQVIFRGGLTLLLQDMPEVEIIGEAANGQEFLDFVAKKFPDIVLMDIKMPVMDGIEATRIAAQKYPKLKILVLSMFGEEEYLVKMLEAGIRGFLLKNVEEDELRKAITMVAQDKNYFSTELLPALTSSFMRKKASDEEKDGMMEKLTKREVEILQYLCKGYTNKEIAEVCFISPRTAGGHRNNLLEKTGCKNTAGLVSYAIKNGLIQM